MKNHTWKIMFIKMVYRVITLSLVLLSLTSVHAQDITISSSVSVTASTSSVIVGGDFTNNGTYNAGNATLKVAGDWSNSGTFTSSTSTVIFNGTGAQSISNSAGETFNNLTVDKSSGTLSLSNNATVNGTLTLTNGLFSIGSNTLTLGTSATIGGTPSSSNMIVADGAGAVKKMFSGIGSFTFPIGDNTITAEYSPATLNFTSGTFSSASASVNATDAKHPNNSSASHFLTRYWTVTSNGISGFSCDVTFNYVDADVTGTESLIYGGKYDNPTWTLLNAANTSGNYFTGTVTSFSDFTGGEQAALPVELISFNARLVKQHVELRWITATEVNNYGFDIERNVISPNAGWEKIGFVEGHGTSNAQNTYQYTDAIDFRLTNAEKIYYRLKQIDRDGKQSYSAIVEVQPLLLQQITLDQSYPNPLSSSGQEAMITFTLPTHAQVKLSVVDNLGKEVAVLVEEVKDQGKYQTQFNPSSLPNGTYYYVLQSSASAKVKKVIVVR